MPVKIAFLPLPRLMRKPWGQGWSFPALFQVGRHWVLLTEANMGRTYCGAHLGHLSPGGEYAVAFPQPSE